MPLKIDSRLAWQVVDGQAIVVDLADGRALGLNATGSFIWSRLESQEAEEIARALAERFDVDAETARAGVARFLDLMRQRHFVASA